ncbi:MAG: M23 family metallopeptidase [Hyphomonadaceae bacterium]
MKRVLCLGLFAAVGAAGCASSHPAPIYYGPAPGTPAAEPNVSAPVATGTRFDTAPAAPVSGDLFVCNRSGSNLGPVDASGRSAVYSPWISISGVTLMRNPTEGACLSSGYGWRNIANGGGRDHGGMDLANPDGGFIYAAGAGRVVRSGPRGSYGLAIEIDHGAGVSTLYGHLAEIAPGVIAGAWAPAGAVIGFMGKTGNATGVHLHYEVRSNSLRVDPLTYGSPAFASSDSAIAY